MKLVAMETNSANEEYPFNLILDEGAVPLTLMNALMIVGSVAQSLRMMGYSEEILQVAYDSAGRIQDSVDVDKKIAEARARG